MKIPTRKKKRSKAKIKTIARIESGNVRCWFEKSSNSICFRQKKSRIVNRILLVSVYEKACGQIVMPFV